MIPFSMIAIDLDGTLIDSVGDLHQAINSMQRQLKLDLSQPSDIRLWIGNGIERLVHRALTNTMQSDAESELFSEAFDVFCQAYHHSNGQHSKLYEHVEESLQWLRLNATPLICVTNKARVFAEPVLKCHNISHYFDHLIAGDDVAAQKPDPAALLEAARRCGADPKHCAMIGDSVSDIKAAKAAGFYSICVSYGYNHGLAIRDMPAADRADVVIDSFSELKNTMRQLSLSR